MDVFMSFDSLVWCVYFGPSILFDKCVHISSCTMFGSQFELCEKLRICLRDESSSRFSMRESVCFLKFLWLRNMYVLDVLLALCKQRSNCSFKVFIKCGFAGVCTHQTES